VQPQPQGVFSWRAAPRCAFYSVRVDVKTHNRWGTSAVAQLTPQQLLPAGMSLAAGVRCAAVQWLWVIAACRAWVSVLCRRRARCH
jgi:hypothetical protein